MSLWWLPNRNCNWQFYYGFIHRWSRSFSSSLTPIANRKQFHLILLISIVICKCVCVIVCNAHFICVTPLRTPTALVHYFSLLLIVLFCRGNLLDLDKYSICHYEHMQTIKFTWVRPLTMRDNTHSKIITKFTRFRSHDKNIQFRERHSVRHSRKIISIYWKISIFSGKFFFLLYCIP